MNSRLIYISNEKLKPLVSWPLLNDSEWIYFGVGNELYLELIRQTIERHLHEETLYVSWMRDQSFECSKAEIINSIKPLLGIEDFTIWDKSFKSVIEFNKIGVLRCGKKT